VVVAYQVIRELDRFKCGKRICWRCIETGEFQEQGLEYDNNEYFIVELILKGKLMVSYQNWVAIGWVGTSLLPTLPLNFDKIQLMCYSTYWQRMHNCLLEPQPLMLKSQSESVLTARQVNEADNFKLGNYYVKSRTKPC